VHYWLSLQSTVGAAASRKSGAITGR
jgi:hypothetical protein